MDEGFQQSFEAFARREHTQLVGALRLYCGNSWIAEDAASEAMIRAADHWGEVSVMANPRAWLYRVAFNVARSQYRRLAAEARAVLSMARTSRQHAEDPDHASRLVVRAAVASLPKRQAQVIISRHFLGMSIEETATFLGLKPGSVKVYTSRAYDQLRKTLGETETARTEHG